MINLIESFVTKNKCYQKIVLDASDANYSHIGYIMFSAQGTGDGVVVTKNEEIL